MFMTCRGNDLLLSTLMFLKPYKYTLACTVCLSVCVYAQVTEGVKNVIVYPSASDKTKNRGFAFIEYDSHRMAAMARKKLISGRIQLWGHNVAVDWAEPEIEVDEDVMAGVSNLELCECLNWLLQGLIVDVCGCR